MSHAHDCKQCGGYWVCDDTCGEEPDALCRDCLLAQNKALRHAVHYIYYHTDSLANARRVAIRCIEKLEDK